MKYKNLKSMAHNHTHSFVSWMNHVNGVYIIDEMRRLFDEREDREIVRSSSLGCPSLDAALSQATCCGNRWDTGLITCRSTWRTIK